MGSCLSTLPAWCFFCIKQEAEVRLDGEETVGTASVEEDTRASLLDNSGKAQQLDRRPNDTTRIDSLDNRTQLLESNHSPKGATLSVAPKQSLPLPDIYGITIGIDEYAAADSGLRRLSYAVKDADDFQSFLENELGVRKEILINLRDSTATRERILDAFLQLGDKLERSKVEKNKTAIIIFYAGHGTIIKKPPTWPDGLTDSDTIEGVVPSDFGEDSKVSPIPDRTIAVLVNRLAKLVGNNVTVIADCCHSAGATRDVDPQVRSDMFVRTIPDDCDVEILGTVFQHGHPYEFFESHVLLAACGHLEKAYEGKGHPNGRFTYDLLCALRKAKEDGYLGYLTYTLLLGGMPRYQDQNPNGFGPTDRLLFTSNTIGEARFMVCLPDQAPNSQQFSLLCGLVYGVGVGHEVDLYTSDQLTASDHLCRCRIESAGNLTSKFSVPKGVQFSSNKPLYCKLVTRTRKFPELSISSNNPDWLFPLLGKAYVRFSRWTTGDPGPDLYSEVDGDRVYIDHRFSFVTGVETAERLPDSIEKSRTTTIQRVVQYAASFHYYLALHPPAQLYKVDMELYKVDSPEHPTTFVGTNVLGSDKPFIVSDSNKDAYGIRICNRSTQNLYVYLFCFDPASLSITELYAAACPAVQGTSTVRPDPCLKPSGQPGSTIQIGLSKTAKHSKGGGKALRFKCKVKADEDVLFLKLFTFPEPQNFTIAQKWRQLVSRDRGDVEEVEVTVKQTPEVWDAKCAKIILRRSKTEWQSSKEIAI